MVGKLRVLTSVKFRAKIKVPQLFSSYRCLTSGLKKERKKERRKEGKKERKKKERKKERKREMALSPPHTFAFSRLPHGFWATI